MRKRHRTARTLAIGFLLLPLDQTGEIPAASRRAARARTARRARIVGIVDPLRDQLRKLYVEIDLLERDDVLAVDVDGDVAELHAVEHIAARGCQSDGRHSGTAWIP